MKKPICFLLSVLLLLSACSSFADEPRGNALKKDIVILFTSDIHCGTDTGLGLGAMLQAKKHFAKDNHVLLVDGGDAFQGDVVGVYSRGMLISVLMDIVGYDVATVGNHDFDYGIDGAVDLLEIMDCPHICVNFFRNGEPVFPPYIIKEFDGVKVALVGALTPATNVSANPARFVDSLGGKYAFATDGTGDELAGLIQKAVDDARAEGADYVILVSHLGNSEADGPYTSQSIIRKTSGIDAVLDGHSHDTEYMEYKDKNGRIVPRQGAGTKMEAIVCLRIGRDGKLSTDLYHWEDQVPAGKLLGYTNSVTIVQQLIDAAKTTVIDKPVGKTDFDLYVFDHDRVDKNDKPLRVVRNHETNCGDFIADAIRSVTGADVAVINGGSVRDDIPKGNITMESLLKVVPFMDHLAVCKCSGRNILDMLEMSVQKLPDEFGGFLQVSGVTFDVRTDIPSPVVLDKKGNFEKVDGQRRVSNVKVGGKPIDIDGKYTLASVEALVLAGVNGYTMFKNCEFTDKEMPLDVDAISGYLADTMKGKMDARYAKLYGEGRINISGSDGSAGSVSVRTSENKAA